MSRPKPPRKHRSGSKLAQRGTESPRVRVLTDDEAAFVRRALDLAIAVDDWREAAALILATPDPFAAETNRIMDHARERLRLENDQIERSLRLRSLRERKASS